MQSLDELRAILRSVTQATVLILLIGLASIYVIPVSEPRRITLLMFFVLTGAASLATQRYVMPLLHSKRWAIYLTGIVHIAIVAVAAFLLPEIDVSSIYMLIVIITAIISTRTAALFAAILVSVTQSVGHLNAHSVPLIEQILRAIIYILTAQLISQLTQMVTQSWRTAVKETDERHAETIRRQSDLQSLYEISQAFGNLDDLPATFRHVTERTAHLLGAEICFLQRFDEARSWLNGIAPGYGLTDEQIAQVQFSVDHEMTNLWDVNQQDYFLLNEIERLPLHLLDLVKQTRVTGFVSARLIVRGRAIGLILVANKIGGMFTENDGRLLSILAGQIAIAVENARLYAETQEHLNTVTRLYAVSSELLSALDPQEIPRRVTQAVADALGAPMATIALVHPHTGILEYAATVGVPDQVVRTPFRANGFGMQVVRGGEPVFINDVQALPDPSPAAQAMNYRAVACLPIRRGERTIGLLYVNYADPHTFTPIEENTLAIFANQTAIALENARLYAGEKRRAAQLAVVNALGHRLTSILDLHELVWTLAHLIRTTFGYRYVHVFTVDPANRRAVLLAGEGPQTQPLNDVEFTLPFGSGMVGWVAEHGSSLLANDVSCEPRFLYHASVADTRSEFTVPLKIGARTIGALDVETDIVNAFDESDVATLETLAGQVAIAIENARLYSELQDQARRDSLTQVYTHGYFMERLTDQIRAVDAMALIMLDIDFFKAYNDRYGHLVGDRVLEVIVQAIRAHLKPTDFVGRWGGEEFIIALPGADLYTAQRIAERVRATLREVQIEKAGQRIEPPTVSQGIAIFPQHTRDPWQLVDLADVALYHAKSSGRDQVCISDGIYPASVKE